MVAWKIANNSNFHISFCNDSTFAALWHAAILEHRTCPGGLAIITTKEQLWWRRRESHPRPKIRHVRFYMCSSCIGFRSTQLPGQDLRRAIFTGSRRFAQKKTRSNQPANGVFQPSRHQLVDQLLFKQQVPLVRQLRFSQQFNDLLRGRHATYAQVSSSKSLRPRAPFGTRTERPKRAKSINLSKIVRAHRFGARGCGFYAILLNYTTLFLIKLPCVTEGSSNISI